MRRTLALASVAALAAAGLFSGSASAADPMCTSQTGGPFDGTLICVATGSLTSGSTPVPYSIGSVCVGGFCTDPVSGTINVPNANVAGFPWVATYGTLCVPGYKGQRICKDFDTRPLFGVSGIFDS